MVQNISDLVTIAGQSVDRATLSGLKTASAKSGVSFQYLVAKAAQESSLKPDAQASTSSAAGLFQFTRGTWLEMMKRYGAQYGYGDMARAITAGPDNKAQVKDPAIEARILALREDPEASGVMAAAYARDNAAALSDSLGRSVDAPDLYLAHFLGPTGASLLLGAAQDDPTKPAASLMPAAAKANPSVFYVDGKPRTAADVVQLVRERFAGQMTRYAQATGAGTDAAPFAPQNTSPPAATASNTTPLNLPSALQGGDTKHMMMSWFVMQEFAKLIAQNPMTMSEESSDSTLTSASLKGSDWANTMSNVIAKSMNPTAPAPPAAPVAMPERPAADQASRAYNAIGGHVAALFSPRKTDDVL